MALFNMVKNHGGELADSTVISLVEQQVTRIEVSVPRCSPLCPGLLLSCYCFLCYSCNRSWR